MVLDSKVFSSGNRKDFFYVLDQMPAMIHFEDLSDLLTTFPSYFPSYNIPYFENVYNYSGTQQMYLKYGNAYSCKKNKFFYFLFHLFFYFFYFFYFLSFILFLFLIK